MEQFCYSKAAVIRVLVPEKKNNKQLFIKAKQQQQPTKKIC